jgi:thiamine-phosphate pyrophosphorylase
VDLHGRLDDAKLYFICDGRPGGRELAEVLPGALAGGVAIFQLRMKGSTDDELLAAAGFARKACDDANALFILNDRPDLVGKTGADGVHVGQDDAAVSAARTVVGSDKLIGVSTHAPAQLRKAIADGADYVGVGPVNETPTKPGRAAVGLEYVRYAAIATGLPFEGEAPANVPGAPISSIPFFAIGGLDTETIGQAATAGATRFAVVRAIAEAHDPELAARGLLAAAQQGALSGTA